MGRFGHPAWTGSQYQQLQLMVSRFNISHTSGSSESENACRDVSSNPAVCVKMGVSLAMTPAASLAVIGRPGLHGHHVTAAVGRESSTVTGGLTYIKTQK